MAIIHYKDMMYFAQKIESTVVTFEVTSLQELEDVIHFHEENQSPLILTVSLERFGERSFAALMSAVEHFAQQTPLPIAISTCNARSPEDATLAIRHGASNVSVQVPNNNTSERRTEIVNICELCHACGVTTEICSSIPMDKDAPFPGEWMETTSADFYKFKLENLQDSDGASAAMLAMAEQINSCLATNALPMSIALEGKYSTHFIQAIDPKKLVNIEFDAPGQHAGHQNLTDSLKQSLEFGSKNRAEQFQANCCWEQVEHLIIFNTENISAEETFIMMKSGQTLLSQIPGVRRVDIGEAVLPDAKYKNTWLVRFCDQSVINSYRYHPIHVQFADTLFRPVAGDRISIDYRIV